MNAMWNVVNAGLATGGLIGASRELAGWDLTRSIEAQHNLEKVYLVNAGLDLGYIMGGLFLAQLGDEYPARADQFEGWGYSIALQGGFLMLFDAVMFIAHRRNREYRPLLSGFAGFRRRRGPARAQVMRVIEPVELPVDTSGPNRRGYERRVRLPQPSPTRLRRH